MTMRQERWWLSEYPVWVCFGEASITVSVFTPDYATNIENHIFESREELESWYEQECRRELFDDL